MGNSSSKKMAPKYKLTYFDGRGRAEITRLCFGAAGVDFEDVRIAGEDWPKVKPTTPTGTLPVLEVGGKKYSQGIAIATFVARELGLYGANNTEGLLIDGVQLQREDLLVEQSKAAFEPDEAQKAEKMKKLSEELVPKTFKYFCDVIKANKAGNGYTVGKKLTLADLVIYEGTQASQDVLDKYPELKALRSKVESSGNIKKYLSKRKETPF